MKKLRKKIAKIVTSCGRNNANMATCNVNTLIKFHPHTYNEGYMQTRLKVCGLFASFHWLFFHWHLSLLPCVTLPNRVCACLLQVWEVSDSRQGPVEIETLYKKKYNNLIRVVSVWSEGAYEQKINRNSVEESIIEILSSDSEYIAKTPLHEKRKIVSG